MVPHLRFANRIAGEDSLWTWRKPVKPLGVCAIRSGGFTMVELLVVIAIIALLIGMLLPAVQAARESARRAQCKNNLHQIGLALHNYHNVFDEFPPQSIRGRHGWAIFTLPYMEQQAVRDLYTFDHPWHALENQAAVQVVIPTFQCPSSRLSGTARASLGGGRWAATNDYAPPGAVSRNLVRAGLIRERTSLEGLLRGSKHTSFRDAADGTSNTLLFAEDTSRPDYYVSSGLGPPFSPATGGNFGVVNGVVKGAGWADARNGIPMHGFTYDGAKSPGPCPINCTNNNEMFSFHSGGVHAVLTDGAVRFISETIDIDTMASLITARAGEVVSVTTYAN